MTLCHACRCWAGDGGARGRPPAAPGPARLGALTVCRTGAIPGLGYRGCSSGLTPVSLPLRRLCTGPAVQLVMDRTVALTRQYSASASCAASWNLEDSASSAGRRGSLFYCSMAGRGLAGHEGRSWKGGTRSKTLLDHHCTGLIQVQRTPLSAGKASLWCSPAQSLLFVSQQLEA